ncbi:MAG: FKBP-type peptidyl-prolyl cis-trans isomerase [Deltaproteobacteria bacterium]|nr:FKBP-type peptidyl-prolyl cis-trans isomerase [Deltaproteobacteria bacterium]
MNAPVSRTSSASFVAGLAAISLLGLGLVACDREEPEFRRRTGRQDNAGQEHGEGNGREGDDHARPARDPHAGVDRVAPPRPEGPPAPPDVAAPPADAQRTASGLASRVLTPGTGTEHPGARDRVTVHYTGWTTDGNSFDSSRTRGEPASFPLNGVIAGWTEGLQLMVVGEQRRFWIPEELAYRGRPNRPAGMLVFDVELISFVAAPTPPTTPEDVAAAPANAERTASGLASRVLRAGTGTTHPTSENVVEVHYSGWTTDGQMFDSSVTRGEPAQFPLGGVIAGWTEGVQLMVEGERRRFWIPESLAYQGRPGAPAGMLVFDVELIRIVR